LLAEFTRRWKALGVAPDADLAYQMAVAERLALEILAEAGVVPSRNGGQS
jgi:hypothetical protein